jgi:NAD+ synthase (glutamine-hydrolysing)
MQARIRGTMLMALSNKHGAIVLTTGNKSEMAVGYATLYGDMAGGFAVLKDVARRSSTRCAHTATPRRVIPERDHRARRPRSCAPTRPTRTRCRPTTSSTRILEATWSTTEPREIVAAGFAADACERSCASSGATSTSGGSRRSASASRPAPFGKDWRVPITSGFV